VTTSSHVTSLLITHNPFKLKGINVITHQTSEWLLCWYCWCNKIYSYTVFNK